MSADEWVGWTMAVAGFLMLLVPIVRIAIEERRAKAVTERMVALVHEYAATDPRMSS